MTNKTAIFSGRVPIETIKQLNGIDRRGLIEEIGRLIADKKLVFRDKTLEICGVDTVLPSVDTCEDCPYLDDLDMSKFNEVCEFKGLDRQQAIDKCASMLWR